MNLTHFKNGLFYLAVFILFFAIFSSIQFSFSNLTDTDPYYHIKQAWLIRTQGIDTVVNNFPWMQCTIFKDYPSDPWLGYHFLLYLFTFGDLILGAKFSAIFFASLLFLGFFWTLRKFKIKYALFWIIFLFFLTDYFTFRVLLARPFVLSILFSFLGFYFVSQKKYLPLFLLSFFYGFITVESPLIIFIALAVAFFDWLKTRNFDWKLPTFAVLGILISLILRPDFPNNFYLLYHQIFSVLFLKFSGISLDFGAELKLPFSGGVGGNIFLFLAFVIPLYWMIFKFIQKKFREIPSLYLSLLFLCLFFAALTFFSTRFIEYWAPFTVLFAALIFNSSILPKISGISQNIKNYKNYDLPVGSKETLKIYQKFYKGIRFILIKLGEKPIKFLIPICFWILIIYFTLNQIFSFSLPLGTKPLTLKNYQEASQWLKENTSPKSLVLNSSWDFFPFLFFYNHQNYYCSGMDPTFMYLKNPKLYWTWRNIISEGVICEKENCGEVNFETDGVKLHNILKEEFRADYLFLSGFSLCDNSEGNFNKKTIEFLESSDKIEKVFERGKIKIYKIK